MRRTTEWIVALVFGLGLGVFLAGTWTLGQRLPTEALPNAVLGMPAVTIAGGEILSYRDVIKQVLPAVVSIESKANPHVATKRPQTPRQFSDPLFPEEFRKFFEDLGTPDRDFSPQLGFGSGFFIDPAGVIVTNYHVVAGADQVVVRTQDGRKFVSKSVHGDKRTDLAVVIVDGVGATFPSLKFGDSDAMEIGDRVLAVGAPFGLAGSVTHGIVSAKGRNLNLNMYEDFLQTDAAINPGNSGGPLINLEGKVVGINAAIKSRNGGFQGVGMAITSNLAKDVVSSLRTSGVVRRGYLGVQVTDLTPDVAEHLKLKSGVVVADVVDGGPAAKGGLQPGDVITTIADSPVKDGKTLQKVVTGLAIGKPAEIHVLRDGRNTKVPVVIEALPKDITQIAPALRGRFSAQPGLKVDAIGVELSDLNDDQAEELGFRRGIQGALITHVAPDGLAASAGVRRGSVLSRVNETKTPNAEAARQALEQASLRQGVLLQIHSPQGGVTLIRIRQN